MKLSEYQNKAKKYDLFGENLLNNPGFIAKIFGLAEETGEVCGKFKKILRDDNGVISEEKKEDIKKELGDILWYVAMISEYMGIDFDEIANTNLNKLESRYKRDALHGSGDDR